MNDWHTPAPGVEDILGTQGRALRRLQGRLLDLFAEHGYDEIIPPLLERPEVLRAGAGRFLMRNTLVFSDPAEHGQLAVRSDMTPQIARIAATRLQVEDSLRLCYSGPVVQARIDPRHGRRQQWQTGVEYMGDASPAADLEILRLAATSMLTAGFSQPVLQLGHVGIVQALTQGSRYELADWVEVLHRRSPEDVAQMLQKDRLDSARAHALRELADLRADASWLHRRKEDFGPCFAAAADALLRLEQQASTIWREHVNIVIDAATMPRFLYHTGLIFHGYAPQIPCAVLRGGRYDEMMAAHGRAMPAIGFSFDLCLWLR